jgi:hypothetical protein
MVPTESVWKSLQQSSAEGVSPSGVGATREWHACDRQTLVFPSRDNGAGIVFEALGCGAVPLVVDFGGPGDIVHPEVGFKVPLTNENDIVAQLQKILGELAANPEQLERLRRQGIAYVRERLTWEAKAQSVTRVLQWAVGQDAKPNFPPPKMLVAAVGSTR